MPDLRDQRRDGSNFGEYRLHILSTLDQIHERLREIEKKLSEVEVSLVSLQIRSGLWGALAGAIPAAGAAAILWLRYSR